MVSCLVCGGTRVIKTEAGIRCRDAACEGSKAVINPGVVCERCDEKMEYYGLNSWGEPNYRCPECGYSAKL
jgi:hypothetical protein